MLRDPLVLGRQAPCRRTRPAGRERRRAAAGAAQRGRPGRPAASARRAERRARRDRHRPRPSSRRRDPRGAPGTDSDTRSQPHDPDARRRRECGARPRSVAAQRHCRRARSGRDRAPPRSSCPRERSRYRPPRRAHHRSAGNRLSATPSGQPSRGGRKPHAARRGKARGGRPRLAGPRSPRARQAPHAPSRRRRRGGRGPSPARHAP